MSDPCQHTDKMARYDRLFRRFDSSRHAIFEWLVISASISILVLAYHMGREIHRIGEAMELVNSIAKEQLTVMQEIHAAVHEEGRRNTDNREAIACGTQKGKK